MKIFIRGFNFFCLTIVLFSALAHSKPRTTHSKTEPHPLVETEDSFSAALRKAIERSEKLKSQKAEAKASDAQLDLARSRYLPTLSAFAENGISDTPRTNSDYSSLGLSLDYNIFRFGADSALIRSKEWGVEEQNAKIVQSLLSFEQGFVAAYLSVLRFRKEKKIRADLIQQAEEYLSIAQKKFSSGAIAREQVDKIQLDLSNSQALADEAESQLIRSLADYKIFSDSENVDLSWPWIDRLINMKTFDRLVRNMKLAAKDIEVPELLAQKSLVQAQQGRVDQATRAMWPELDLRLVTSQRLSEGDRDHVWTGTVTLTAPLFEGLGDRATQNVERAQLMVQNENLNLLQRKISALQIASLQELEVRIRTARQREEMLTTARRLLVGSIKRFRVGRIEADELNEDQSRVARAESVAIDGWYQAHIALVSALHAHGIALSKISSDKLF